jgi:hypothetical protein
VQNIFQCLRAKEEAAKSAWKSFFRESQSTIRHMPRTRKWCTAAAKRRGCKQCDQIGRIFAQWAVAYYLHMNRFSKITEVPKNLGYFLTVPKSHVLTLTKNGLAKFWVIFYKLWSPWMQKNCTSIHSNCHVLWPVLKNIELRRSSKFEVWAQPDLGLLVCERSKKCFND